MFHDTSRRRFLRNLGIVGGALALGPQVVSAEPADDRFIVDAEARDELGPQIKIVHDFEDEIGYLVVTGPRRQIPANVDFAHDRIIELDVPAEASGGEYDAPEKFPLQWDKQDQHVPDVHEMATGDGARVGIIDSGVLGANTDEDFEHPDLEENVNEELSMALVADRRDGGDRFGPGPLESDHGTHVAGTAAATSGGEVVGHAPDAEIVDFRVFSGLTASFADIVAAHIYAAKNEADGGADCDVVNLSLGTPPYIPVDDPDEFDDETVEAIAPYFLIEAGEFEFITGFTQVAARYALEHGTLLVSSAGNDGVNVDELPPELDEDDVADVDVEGFEPPTQLPAGLPEFMSVSATGPIGFRWDPEDAFGGTDIDPIASLKPTEPSFFTTYGPETTDVSAPGGNADLRAGELEDETTWFLDLVLSTEFDETVWQDADQSRVRRRHRYPPIEGWKAGTSMAAPQVTGLAALLFELDPDATPEEVREHIQNTAEEVEIGAEDNDLYVTTAPDPADEMSGFVRSTEERPDSATYRGNGHINTFSAVNEWSNE